jgi:hypothetical protein
MTRRRRRRPPAVVLGIAAAAMLFLSTKTGVTSENSYTSIAERSCRKLDVLRLHGDEISTSRVCSGRGGYKVFITEDDLRETLTVGRTMKEAAKEPAAHDRHGAFNSFEGPIEWRSTKDGKLYALIVGWAIADNDNPDAAGRPKSVYVLVVMRLPPGPVCRIAYVDRDANGDARELARTAASEMAPHFNCGGDKPKIVGERGEAIQVLSRGLAD